ncbi:MAG: GNAT family N-acetyltransferase [Legionellales bacterium]|nr:GNAT family N-acetyltransferase [Legionellales bacterium]
MNEISYFALPNNKDIDFLTYRINAETSEYGRVSPFGFFAKDSSEQIIAGANGYLLYGTIYTDQLWVMKNYRNKGIARNIMDKIHSLGKEAGSTMATVQTMSFQSAERFYEKLGYIKDFQRFGYINNSYCIFMKKTL